MFGSILQAERSQRQKLQQDLARVQNLLHVAIRTLDPDLIEAQRHQNPQFLDQLDLDGWTQLLQDAKRRDLDRWWGGGEQPHLKERLQRLQKENTRLLQRLGIAQRRVTALTLHLQEVEVKHETWRQANAPAPLHMPGGITLPLLPPAPPPDFRELLLDDTWERDSQFLAILAVTGWSQQHALLDELANRLDISPKSGTFTRQVKRMAAAGLIHKESIPVPFGRVNILRLTNMGRHLADALNIIPVESEWERLQRMRGAGLDDHHAMICLFSMAARQRGYRTQVCPPLEASATCPDVLIVNPKIERNYVFVEMGDSPAGERIDQWQAVAKVQGFVALCASTAESRQALLKVASDAGLTGRVTDFESLRQHLPNTLWAEQWPAAQPKPEG